MPFPGGCLPAWTQESVHPPPSPPFLAQIIRCQQLAAGEAALGEWLAAFRPAAATRLTLRCCAVLDGPPVPGKQQSIVAVLPAAGGSAGGGTDSSPAVVRALLDRWAPFNM